MAGDQYEALIRHHHRGRNGLFAPTGMENIPVKLEELTGSKDRDHLTQSYIQYVDRKDDPVQEATSE